MDTVDQAVVLVGGFGTRLGEATKSTPKPLLSVGGRPFLDYVLRAVAAAGVEDIVLLAGYLGDQVRDLYEGRLFGEARVRVLVEPAPLGTAGGLRHFAAELRDRFYVLNGDSYFDFDLNRLSPPLSNESVSGVLALCSVEDTRRFGRVLSEASGGREVVTAFLEKDSQHAAGAINAGLYAFKRDILRYIGRGPESLERAALPALVAERKVDGVRGKGCFIDIGTPEHLEAARSALPPVLARPAVFFDRDGTLNVDSGYTHRLEDLRLTDGAIEAITNCNEAGYYVFVVTNQAGVARGYYDEAAVRAFHRTLQKALRGHGAHVDGFYFCPHHPEGTVERYKRVCSCRKPAPGLIQRAFQEWPIDRPRSVLIGDRESDVLAGAACGIRSLLFEGGNLNVFLRDRGVI
jgi:D,D-heptose 1,7-bisphosphate phosphatase